LKEYVEDGVAPQRLKRISNRVLKGRLYLADSITAQQLHL